MDRVVGVTTNDPVYVLVIGGGVVALTCLVVLAFRAISNWNAGDPPPE